MYEIKSDEVQVLANLYRKIARIKVIDELHTDLLKKILYISQFYSELSDLLDEIDSELESNSLIDVERRELSSINSQINGKYCTN
jgi:hypothetical protein